MSRTETKPNRPARSVSIIRSHFVMLAVALLVPALLAIGVLQAQATPQPDTALVTTSPEVLEREQDVSIEVSGLEASTSYTMVLFVNDGTSPVYQQSITTDAEGVTGLMLTSETSDPLGIYRIEIRDDAGTVIATGQFELAESASGSSEQGDATAVPTESAYDTVVTILPSQADAGSTHDVLVSGLAADTRVDIIVMDGSGGVIYRRARNADDEGRIEFQLFTRRDAMAGQYTLQVIALDGEIIGEGTFDVVSAAGRDPEFSIAVQDGELLLTGANFQRFADLRLRLVNLEDRQSTYVKEFRATVDGTLDLQTQPELLPPGEYQLSLEDNDGVLLTGEFVNPAYLFIETPNVSISSQAADAATRRLITASGLEAGSPALVEIVSQDGTQVLFERETTIDVNGNIAVSAALPDDTADGFYPVLVVVDEDIVGNAYLQVGEGELNFDDLGAGTFTPDQPEVTATASPTATVGQSATAEAPEATGTPAATGTGEVTAEATAELSGSPTAIPTPTVSGNSIAPSGEAQMSIEPESGSVGQSFTVTVAGVDAGQSIDFAVEISGEVVFETSRQATSDNRAVLVLTTSPSDEPGDYLVIASIDGNEIAQATFVIVPLEATSQATPAVTSTAAPIGTPTAAAQPGGDVQLLVQPEAAPRGGRYLVSAVGLTPDEQVTLRVLRGEVIEYETTLTADRNGTASVDLVSDDSDEAGTLQVLLLRGDEVIAEASLTIEDDDAGTAVPGMPTLTPTGTAGPSLPTGTLTVIPTLTGIAPTATPSATLPLQTPTAVGTAGPVVTADATRMAQFRDFRVLSSFEPTAVQLTANGDGAANVFVFQGEQGDSVNVVVDGERSFDTRLDLYTADGTLVADDDDGGRGLQPELFGIVLQQTGNYYLVVSSNSTRDGEVIVTLEIESSLASLNDGAQTITVDADGIISGQVSLRPSGNADLVRIEITGNIEALTIRARQRDQRLTQVNYSDSIPSVVIFTVQASGDDPVEITIAGLGDASTTLTVSLEADR